MPYLRIRFERQRRHWTQAALGEMAERCGLHRALTQSEISAIEHGRLNPTDRELTALARILGVDRPEALLEPIDGSGPEQVEGR